MATEIQLGESDPLETPRAAAASESITQQIYSHTGTKSGAAHYITLLLPSTCMHLYRKDESLVYKVSGVKIVCVYTPDMRLVFPPLSPCTSGFLGRAGLLLVG